MNADGYLDQICSCFPFSKLYSCESVKFNSRFGIALGKRKVRFVKPLLNVPKSKLLFGSSPLVNSVLHRYTPHLKEILEAFIYGIRMLISVSPELWSSSISTP